MSAALLLPDSITACLFDLDGVITHTADLHAAAWKQTFDDLLRRWAVPDEPVLFDAIADYDRYVDGKPRAAGVRSFLASRGIELAARSPADVVSADTLFSVGRRKNRLVQELMAQQGVAAYQGSVVIPVLIAPRLLQHCYTGNETLPVPTSSSPDSY